MANYIPISTVTVGAGGASSINFVNIPQNYTDLNVLLSVRSNTGGAFAGLVIAFNGSSAGYTLTWLGDANGSAVTYVYSAFGYNHIAYIPASTATANSFGNVTLTMPDYTSSHAKAVNVDGANANNATTIYQGFSIGSWSGTAPISSLSFTTGGSFVQYSTATLYGLRKY
jgi:hypothetical protein